MLGSMSLEEGPCVAGIQTSEKRVQTIGVVSEWSMRKLVLPSERKNANWIQLVL